MLQTEQLKQYNIFKGRQAFFRSLACLLILLTTFSSLSHADVITLNPEQEALRIGSHIQYLEDPTQGLEFQEILGKKSDLFTKSDQDIVTIGYTNSAYWVKFTVYNPSHEKIKWFLLREHFYPSTLFTSHNGEWTSQPVGDVHTRENYYEQIYLPLELKPLEKKTYYLRMTSRGSLRFDFQLYTQKGLRSKTMESYGLFGIYYGALLIMILYNFFLFISIRDPNYLLYVSYLSVLFILQLFLDGLVPLVTGYFEVYWHSPIINILVACTGILVALFTKQFLELDERYPVLRRTIHLYIILYVVCGLLPLLPFTSPQHYHPIMSMLILFNLPFFLGLSLHSLIARKMNYVRFFCLSWGVYFFHIGIFLLDLFSLLPHTFYTKYSLHVGSILEAVLFSLALADRYNTMKRERMEAQQKMNEQATAVIQKLKHIDGLKDRFLANTTHELLTPLHGMIGLSQAVLQTDHGELNGENHQRLSMIVGSGKRLAALIGDILDFSTLKNKELHLKLEPIAVPQILEVVLQLSQPLLQHKPLQFINNVPSELPNVIADENRIYQVLYNLLGNAIKFTSKGHIRIFSEVKANELVIHIEDTGIGIPKEEQELIFEAFERTEQSHTEAIHGAGLGLSLCKTLIELQKGKIWLQSEPEKGSTFSFSLPTTTKELSQNKELRLGHLILPPDSEANDRGANPTQPDNVVATSCSTQQLPQAHFRILVVDDDSVNLELIKGQLSYSYLDIVLVHDGHAALSAIEESPPDLVLLDLMMPEISGIEVCQKIREQYSLIELPVIILTAKNQLQSLIDALQVGANDYITKPFIHEELLARVNACLNIRLAVRRFSVLKSLRNTLGNTLQGNKFRSTLFSANLEAFPCLCAAVASDDEIILYEGSSSDRRWAEAVLQSMPNDALGSTQIRLDSETRELFYYYWDENLYYMIRPGSEHFNQSDIAFTQAFLEVLQHIRQNIHHLLFHTNPKLMQVLLSIKENLDSIHYITKVGNEVEVVFTNEQPNLMCEMTLLDFPVYFDANIFIRIHRSYLVPKFQIQRIIKDRRSGRLQIALRKNKIITIGDSYLTAVQAQLPHLFVNI